MKKNDLPDEPPFSKKTTKEWDMVAQLHSKIRKIRFKNQRNFIRGLFNNLDPYSAFLDEQSPQQLEYLTQLYRQYIKP